MSCTSLASSSSFSPDSLSHLVSFTPFCPLFLIALSPVFLLLSSSDLPTRNFGRIPFVVEPQRVLRLPPGQAQEITVTYCGNKTKPVCFAQVFVIPIWFLAFSFLLPLSLSLKHTHSHAIRFCSYLLGQPQEITVTYCGNKTKPVNSFVFLSLCFSLSHSRTHIRRLPHSTRSCLPTFLSRIAFVSPPPFSRSLSLLCLFLCFSLQDEGLGVQEVVLPLMIRGGARYDVTLRALVAVPDLELSQPALDFGDVFCGFRKEVTLFVTNKKQV